jgi:hypothetical protein
MSNPNTITVALDPAADALLERIAEADGRSKAEIAADVLSRWLAATLDRLDERDALEDTLERLGNVNRGDRSD